MVVFYVFVSMLTGKILEDPGKAIGVVQAQGLSVMCAEVVESANEIRQAVTAALYAYRYVT